MAFFLSINLFPERYAVKGSSLSSNGPTGTGTKPGTSSTSLPSHSRSCLTRTHASAKFDKNSTKQVITIDRWSVDQYSISQDNIIGTMPYPPRIDAPPSILNKPDGSAVLFECIMESDPAPEVKWFFKDQEIVAGDRYAINIKKKVGKYNATLKITGPNQNDQGIYKVVATNAGGKAEKEQTYVLVCTANSMYANAD